MRDPAFAMRLGRLAAKPRRVASMLVALIRALVEAAVHAAIPLSRCRDLLLAQVLKRGHQ